MIGLRSFSRIPAQQIPLPSIGISADHVKLRAAFQAFMANTGWNHKNVAGFHIKPPAVFPSELQRGPAAVDSQHLMRSAVVVVKGENPRAPRSGPAVFCETLLDDGVSGEKARR